MRSKRTLLLALGVGFAASASPGVAADRCADLRGERIGDAVVIEARAEAAGPFRPPAMFGRELPAIEVPASCRITAVTSTVPGSRIELELWLPQDGWNRRLKMLGNGGYSSSLPYQQMAGALAAGYAVTATDTGHKGDDPSFAIGLPESIVDWGHRAVHQSVVAAKALTDRYYAAAPSFSYFEGCSTGGHQALMEAQRYPDDFDGIVAGAPGNNRTHLNIGFLWQFVANHRADGSLILPASKLPLLTQGVLKACGTASERTRGYLEDPLSCRFDPALLACEDEDGAADTCLVPEEVAALRRLYAGARSPRTGEQIYPAWLPGSETGWSLYWADPLDPRQPARANFFRFWAFSDPQWNWRDFDFDRSVAQIDPRVTRAIDAVDPDLSPFRRSGGKLIVYHGLADPVVSPLDTVNYYRNLRDATEGDAGDFARLFLAPGMGHCGGGPGAVVLEASEAIEEWVEKGVAPESLPATYGEGSSAPSLLCPFGENTDRCRKAPK